MLRGVVTDGSPVPGEKQLAIAEQGWGSDEMWSYFLPQGPLADQGWLGECPCGSCPGWVWGQAYRGWNHSPVAIRYSQKLGDIFHEMCPLTPGEGGCLPG